jgi:hypothetical protein
METASKLGYLIPICLMSGLLLFPALILLSKKDVKKSDDHKH